MAAYDTGRIYQINISRGGVPKLPVEQAEVMELGLKGDEHNDMRDHGGPMRALCLYTLEQIQRLQAEAHGIFPGLAGENITLQGIDQAALVPGVRMALGDTVEIELTSYAAPCKTITESFYDGDFTRISHKTHPGESRIYAKILRTGQIRTGDLVRLLGE
ncbi:MAG: MOSC domain-containing protein [Ktedonobacterales bacterium]